MDLVFPTGEDGTCFTGMITDGDNKVEHYRAFEELLDALGPMVGHIHTDLRHDYLGEGIHPSWFGTRAGGGVTVTMESVHECLGHLGAGGVVSTYEQYGFFIISLDLNHPDCVSLVCSSGNHPFVLLATFTRLSMIGTSTSTPTTVTRVAPELRP